MYVLHSDMAEREPSECVDCGVGKYTTRAPLFVCCVYKNKNNNGKTVARIVHDRLAGARFWAGVCRQVYARTFEHFVHASCVRATDSKLVLSSSSSIYDRFAHTAAPTKHTHSIRTRAHNFRVLFLNHFNVRTMKFIFFVTGHSIAINRIN